MNSLKYENFNKTSNCKFFSLLSLIAVELILIPQTSSAVIKFPKRIPKYHTYDLATSSLTTTYLGINATDECNLSINTKLKNSNKSKFLSNKKCLDDTRKIS